MRKTIALLALFLAGSVQAQTVTPVLGGAIIPLFRSGASVANGADLTEDTLQTFTLPAGQLANVGDALHVMAGGALGATTDSKAPRITFGGTRIANKAYAGATNVFWLYDIWVVKTGANTQRVFGGINAQAGTWAMADTTQAITDTAAIVVLISGQNSTNPVAGSITCDFVTIDFMRAP